MAVTDTKYKLREAVRLSKYLITCIFVFTILQLSSCSDETDFNIPSKVVEGEPARITLNIAASHMSIQTREVGNATMDPADSRANIINSLWVGIFNKSTGKRLGVFTLDQATLSTLHQTNGNITINDIPSYSGECYIVGVANYTNRNGITTYDNTQWKSIAQLLEDADTWEKYKSIVRILDEPTTQRGGNDLIMSGVYQSSDNDSEFESKLEEDGDPPTVVIYPGNNDLTGRIHLRRLDSYIRVNLKPGPNINFTPQSWQIINMPATAFIHEQNGNASDLKRVADKMPNGFEGVTYFNSNTYSQGTFHSIFGGNDNKTITGYWFDFYQMENKHTGLETVKNYNDREREFKYNDLNTGWYESLVSSPNISEKATIKYKETDGEIANNNATFIVITGDVDYYYYIDTNNNHIPASANTENATHRIATVTWTIHLGYCEGSDEEKKAKDFNCKRNSNYTYNITVNGVDNIRLEAIREGEIQPGAEGTVSDVLTKVYSLDSHYGVVNIALSDDERKSFIWRIQSSFGGQIIDMMSSPDNSDPVTGDIINVDKNQNIKDALPQNQFYNWIQIRPTRDATTIAHYPGDIRLIGREIPYVDLKEQNGLYPTNNIKEGVDGVWYLEDLRDVSGHPHPYDTSSASNEKKWYTVFIDEYVWEYPIDMSLASFTGRDNSPTYNDHEQTGIQKEVGVMSPTEWGKYVGEPDRKLWITSDKAYISTDKESVYNSAIYYISQESIQTYYSERASSGIGIECTNESFLSDATQWQFSSYNGGNYDPIDGYLNQYRFAQTYNNSDENVRLKWDEIFSQQEQGDRNGFFYKFRNGQKHEGDNMSDMTYYIRDHKNEYMIACLSRNRDLNNDGQIGSNEIRWYLPTDQTYTRIILGATSLKSPLFELNKYTKYSITAGQGKIYSHYAASNNRMTWAEELASTGVLNNGNAVKAGTLRCIRNIGQPTYWTPGNDNSAYKAITLAYEHDAVNRTIEMKYYDNTALRNAFYGPWEYIRSHNVGSVDSYAYRKFKYAKGDCDLNQNLASWLIYQNNRGNVRIGTDKILSFYEIYGNGLLDSLFKEDNTKRSVDYWSENVNNNGFCRAYYENADLSDLGSWRTPNITELGILKLFGNILEDANYISCSQEYFVRQLAGQDEHYRFMVTFGQDIAARYPARANGLFHIRCVKDVR